MEKIPDIVFVQICSNLELADFIRIISTCKYLNSLSDLGWRKLYSRDFPDSEIPPTELCNKFYIASYINSIKSYRTQLTGLKKYNPNLKLTSLKDLKTEYQLTIAKLNIADSKIVYTQLLSAVVVVKNRITGTPYGYDILRYYSERSLLDIISDIIENIQQINQFIKNQDVSENHQLEEIFDRWINILSSLPIDKLTPDLPIAMFKELDAQNRH